MEDEEHQAMEGYGGGALYIFTEEPKQGGHLLLGSQLRDIGQPKMADEDNPKRLTMD